MDDIEKAERLLEVICRPTPAMITNGADLVCELEPLMRGNPQLVSEIIFLSMLKIGIIEAFPTMTGLAFPTLDRAYPGAKP